MPLTHWFPSRGPKPISLVFRHSSCLNLHWPSKTFIHPPRMTMTDLATKRSICFPLSFSFLLLSHSLSLFSFSFTSFSCYFVDVQNMMKKWECRSPWHREHVRVTMQSLFDLGEQLIHMFIYLYFWHITFHFSESLQIIHANIESQFFACRLWFCRLVDLWPLGSIDRKYPQNSTASKIIETSVCLIGSVVYVCPSFIKL